MLTPLLIAAADAPSVLGCCTTPKEAEGLPGQQAFHTRL